MRILVLKVASVLALGWIVSASLGLATAFSAEPDLVLRWHSADGAVVAERALDAAAVEALPQVEFTTETPWTSGEQRFSGPSLGTLAALGGVPVGEARLTALNDYEMSVPAEDWEQHGAILAIRRNGEFMPVKDKGPYWVMYPISSDPALNSQFYHGRMVWQVKYIDFEPK
jgi:hypothetical protein